jgi:KipI family sensor histidine kinase inhibitor
VHGVHETGYKSAQKMTLCVSRETLRMSRMGRHAWLLQTGSETQRWFACLRQQPWPGLRDMIPGEETLLVVMAPGARLPCNVDPGFLSGEVAWRQAARHVLQVRYGGKQGPDLVMLSQITGLSPAALIERHAGADYEVMFLGFQPGFAYLSGTPAELMLPRRATPRAHVPAGSLAVAGGYTGIYPGASPAGWHILGQIEVPLFDPEARPPALLQPGDSVRFLPC